MAEDRETSILLQEYAHMWSYYNKIHENNQKLYDNFFRAVSVFGALIAVSAAILNFEAIDLGLPFQMLLVGVVSFGVIGLGLVGHNSLITFAREVGNSQIYLENMKQIRNHLWETTPGIKESSIEPIHEMRSVKVPEHTGRVSDSRILIFVALNSIIFTSGIFTFCYAAMYSALLIFGDDSASAASVGRASLGSLATSALFFPVVFFVERNATFRARDVYFRERMPDAAGR